MLKAEKRHTKAGGASEYDGNVKKCKCPYGAVGMLNGVFVRKALKTSSEEQAQKVIRRWEGDGQPDEPKDRVPVTVPQAVTPTWRTPRPAISAMPRSQSSRRFSKSRC